MPDIDVELSADLTGLLELPSCQEIKLPDVGGINIQLPTGGSFKAISDLSKGVPTDCSLSFSLMVQLAPLLASMECIVKILALLKPLIDIVKGLPVPPVKAVQEFVKAGVDLAPCLLIPTPAAIAPFIRDILCLILKMLNCFIGQMKTILAVMTALGSRIELAAGNAELLATLQCAQDNAESSAKQLTNAIEPLRVILDLVKPLMDIAGIDAIEIPALAPDADPETLNQTLETVQGVVGTLTVAVEALGGCS